MTALFRAELYRLRTTRSTWGFLAGALGIVALVLYPLLVNAGVGSMPSLGTSHSLDSILSAPRVALPFAALLGVMAVAGEYRHRTITTALLVTPRRARLVGAKAIAFGFAGLAVGTVTAVLTVLVAWGWHAGKGVAFDLLTGDVARTIVGVAVAGALLATVGVGVGALIRNQAAAMVTVLVWLQIVELSLLAGIAPQAFAWTGNGTALALVGAAPPSPILTVFAPVPAGLLLAAYAAVLALAALRTTLGRDVT